MDTKLRISLLGALVFTVLQLFQGYPTIASAASEAGSAHADQWGTDAVASDIFIAQAAGTKWIDVNLRTQSLVAYQGGRAVFSTRISSGVTKHPTVTGTFHVYAKLPSERMTGGVGREHYDLPNVPNVMYFYAGFAIHGTYWHHSFGHPMSHGCVNANQSAAAWLYQWTPYGTRVTIHY